MKNIIIIDKLIDPEDYILNKKWVKLSDGKIVANNLKKNSKLKNDESKGFLAGKTSQTSKNCESIRPGGGRIRVTVKGLVFVYIKDEIDQAGNKVQYYKYGGELSIAEKTNIRTANPYDGEVIYLP